jgi:hypothetical protein
MSGIPKKQKKKKKKKKKKTILKPFLVTISIELIPPSNFVLFFFKKNDKVLTKLQFYLKIESPKKKKKK